MALYLMIVGALVAIVVSDWRNGIRPFDRLYWRRK